MSSRVVASVGPEVRRAAVEHEREHLGVLRAVGLVHVRTQGRHRWYRVNGPALKPVHDWVRSFESTWNARFDRLDDLLAELDPTEESP